MSAGAFYFAILFSWLLNSDSCLLFSKTTHTFLKTILLMRTLNSQATKTPQNRTITFALKGQEYPFCIQNLRIWPKPKPFVCRPPSIQVSFLVSFLFLCHLLKTATHTRNISCLLRNPSFHFPARSHPLFLLNKASIANLQFSPIS
jgi:hypothetical protein